MRKVSRETSAVSYRSYLLALLATILALNNIDGVALSLVLQNIKDALHLTDSELGLLTGIAFTLFYSTFGVQIGRWADRGNRVSIIAISTGLWSIMVMLVGSARAFGQLLLIRMGVAVGESGCMPPAYSLISDNFSRNERPRAIANYQLGGSLSLIIGNAMAGWLCHLYGWRTMFVLLGIPGLVVAPLAWWTLREPRISRASPAAGATSGMQRPSLAQVARELWANKTFRRIVAMLCINYFFASGMMTWQPSFFIRSYGFDTEQLGFWLSAVYGVCGFAGTYLGGYLAARYAPGDEAAQLRVLAALNAVFGLISAATYASGNPYVALSLVGLSMFGVGLEAGPLFATVQTVIPERMRAVSISVVFLFANLVGTGLGPLVVGSLSDALHPFLGQESLRYALLAMCPGYLWGGWQLWRGAQTVRADVEAASQAMEPQSSDRCAALSCVRD